MNKNIIVLGKECNNNNSIPDFIYRDLNNEKSTQYQIIQENSNDWRIYFYESGTLTFLQNKPEYLDVFLVGGGAGGTTSFSDRPGGGGSGGFTQKGIVSLDKDTYKIIIGKGGKGETAENDKGSTTNREGGATTAFELTALGGSLVQGETYYTTRGGSGGGGIDKNTNKGKNGGSDGKDGEEARVGSNVNGNVFYSGFGQGFTTREFYEPTGILYSGGGGGASKGEKEEGGKGGEGGGGNGSNGKDENATAGLPNTGGGGGGGNTKNAKDGGSGIVVIRNLRI